MSGTSKKVFEQPISKKVKKRLLKLSKDFDTVRLIELFQFINSQVSANKNKRKNIDFYDSKYLLKSVLKLLNRLD